MNTEGRHPAKNGDPEGSEDLSKVYLGCTFCGLEPECIRAISASVDSLGQIFAEPVCCDCFAEKF